MKAHQIALNIAAASLVALMPAGAATTTLLSEDWEYAKTSSDINNDTGLHSSIGYGLNDNNPTTLLNGGVGTGGNVLLDQSGFGGTYGSSDSAGSSIRVRSSNGAWLNRNPLALASATSATFTFDLRQNTANYVHVVEYSGTQDFSAIQLLDTIDGNSNLGVWIAKSYTVTTDLTDDAYFRVRKLRPSPAGTNGGANSTSHAYDNMLITAEVVPEPSAALLGALGFLALLRRRR